MNKKIIKTYNRFLNEGTREEDKIDDLLDIINKRKLTKEEHDLLTRLSKGEKLPEDKSSIVSHKTGGGYVFDKEGNVLTEDEPSEPGQEFTTIKGKQNSAEQLKKSDVIDARVYRHKDKDERFFFVNTTADDNLENGWIIYRTGASLKFPLGQLMNTKNPNYAKYKNYTPELLWSELDLSFDYGMVLDDELYRNIIEFIDLYDNGLKNIIKLQRLRNRFIKLL